MPDVLVVDDDPHLREVVSYALSRAGIGVRTARDGLEALREVDRKAPDLVVLDVLLPERKPTYAASGLAARFKSAGAVSA